MVNYKIVKHCRRCKVRYVVMKGQNRKNYCDDCQKKLDKENSSEE